MGSDVKYVPVPPAGCDGDAVKLYIGNLPLTSTEADLVPLLSPFGKVCACICECVRLWQLNHDLTL